MKKQLLFVLALAIFSYSANAQTILGIDISHYQGTINWSQVKTSGKIFAWCKATEGTGTTDATFAANMVNGEACRSKNGGHIILQFQLITQLLTRKIL